MCGTYSGRGECRVGRGDHFESGWWCSGSHRYAGVASADRCEHHNVALCYFNDVAYVLHLFEDVMPDMRLSLLRNAAWRLLCHSVRLSCGVHKTLCFTNHRRVAGG